jgi:putative ABC transport system permease protein
VGVETHDLLVAQLSFPAAAYPQPDDHVLFYDQLLERAGSLPGVRAAALSNVIPPASGGQFHVRIEGVHEAWTMDLPVARARAVSANYFEAMGIPVLAGRGLAATDVSDAPMVIVVDQAFVDQHFPGEDPIGRQVRTLLDLPREIVGVVGHVANTGLATQAAATTYVPYRQHAFGNTQTLILRTASDPTSFVPAAQGVVWELDPTLPLVGVGTLEDRLASSVAQPRFNSMLLGLFAVLALTLAGVGIYGVMAYTVSERTAELGLRMALGAPRASVRGLVVRKALRLTIAGIALGLAASLGLTRVIAGFLFGVEPTDPVTFASVSVLLCLVALFASYVPAVRASRLDPLRALHNG